MSKLTIVTLADRRPDLIEIQNISFIKHIQDDFEFVVLNNAFDKARCKEIEGTCLRLGLREIKVRIDRKLSNAHGEKAFKFGKYRNPNLACSYAMQWFWNYVLPSIRTDFLVFIDSDMFMMDAFSLEAIMQGSDVAYIPQFRGANLEVEYPWNGIFAANLRRMDQLLTMDWHPGRVEGFPVDVGGQNHFWLNKNKEMLEINELHAFTLYDIETKSDKTSAHVAIDGNWNANFDVSYEGKVSFNFQGFETNVPDPSEFSVPKRLFGASWSEDFAAKHFELLTRFQEEMDFPKPVYFDLIGHMENGNLIPSIFHYKSGSNYQPWATEIYNAQKTKALMKIVGITS